MFAVAVTNWLRVPLLVFPLRETIMGWLLEVDATQQPQLASFIKQKNFKFMLNVALVAFLFCLTASVGNIQVALIILGFSGVPMLCYIIPGLMCLKIASDYSADISIGDDIKLSVGQVEGRAVSVVPTSAASSSNGGSSAGTSPSKERAFQLGGAGAVTVTSSASETGSKSDRMNKSLGGSALTAFGIVVSIVVFVTYVAKNVYHVPVRA